MKVNIKKLYTGLRCDFPQPLNQGKFFYTEYIL